MANTSIHRAEIGGARTPRRGAAAVMRALILANRVPFPPDDGWKVRCYHVVRSVAATADVTLVVFGAENDAQLAAAREELGVDLIAVAPPRRHTPDRLLAGLVSRTPVTVLNQRSRAYTSAIRQVVGSRRFDVALCVSTIMSPHLRLLPAGLPRVIDTHNIDAVTYERWARTLAPSLRRRYTALTAAKLRRFEQRAFAEAALVWVCSDEEAALARELAPGANVWTVPNGVDTQHMSPLATPPVPKRLLFFGRLDYFPNVDALAHFARDVLPLVRAAEADVELEVVGAAATAQVHALARDHPAVRLRGRVEDIRSVLASAAVVIVPLRVGGGTRLKIVEALSMARPTVSTTIGAEGLDLVPGEDLLVADTPAEFAAAIRSLLDDPQWAAQLGAHGRRTVRDRYDWRQVGQVIEASLASLTP